MCVSKGVFWDEQEIHNVPSTTTKVWTFFAVSHMWPYTSLTHIHPKKNKKTTKAGTDTTATALHFGVYLLAKDEKTQEKLYQCLAKMNDNGDKRRTMLHLTDLVSCAEFRAFVVCHIWIW